MNNNFTIFLTVIFFLLSTVIAKCQDINNDVCNAILLTVDENCSGYEYSTEFATGETSEPNCPVGEDNTVWFKFVAPTSGLVNLTFKGGTIGLTRIGIYTISDCNDLSTAAEVSCSTGTPSNIKVVPGTTYYIQVDSFGGPNEGEGTFCIIVNSCNAPLNDDVCDAILLAVDSNCTGHEYTTVCSTGESSEPDCPNGANNTVWFKFIALASGLVNITLKEGTIGLTRIGIYTISDCNDLSTAAEVSCSSGTPSNINVVAGTTYYLQVDSFGGPNEGEGTFCIIVNSCNAPLNDDVCDAILLAVDSNCTNYEYTTECSTGETSEPDCPNGSNNTVWFKFVAPTSGLVNITLKEGTIGLTRIGIYTITDCNDLSTATEVSCSSGTPSNINVVAGTTYYLQVDSFGGPNEGEGTFCIIVNSCNAPLNDDVCDAVLLAVDSNCTGYEYTTVCSTGETSEPDCPNGANNTVWFKFVAPASELVNITLKEGTIGLTRVGIYTITDCNDLSTAAEVSCSTGTPSNINVVAGTTYYIQVDSFGGSNEGEGTFCILVTEVGTSVSAPCTNDFACDAITLILNESCSFYSSECSTSQTGESSGSCYSGSDLNSIWFDFTAPASGRVRIREMGLLNEQWAVYNVPNCSDLSTATEIFCSRDSEEFVDGLTAGVVYYIQIDGEVDDKGEVCLEIESCDIIPTNDLACDAISLVLNESCSFYSSECSTSQTGESSGSCFSGSDLNSIWFNFTAPASGRITIREMGLLDEQWVIYNVPNCNDLSTASELFCSRDSEEFIDGLTAGVVYYIQVDGELDVQGEVCIEIESCDILPTNDLACNAISVVLNESCSFYSSECSISQSGESSGSCYSGSDLNSIWFDFTAPASGRVTIREMGLLDEQWAVYNVPNCSDLSTATEIFCSRDSEEFVDGLTAGVVYYIQVDGTVDTQDEVCLEIESCDIVPTNDLACNAITLALDEPCSFYTTECSTSQAGENSGSCYSGSNLNSIWFKFTAPASGSVIVLESGLIDEQWAIYTVPNCSDLSTATEIFCSRDDEEFVQGLNPGAIYYIQVDGSQKDFGEVCLKIEDSANLCTQPSQRYLSGILSDTVSFQAKNSILAVQQLLNTSDVNYIAEDEILLLPGFSTSGELLITIEDCEN